MNNMIPTTITAMICGGLIFLLMSTSEMQSVIDNRIVQALMFFFIAMVGLGIGFVFNKISEKRGKSKHEVFDMDKRHK